MRLPTANRESLERLEDARELHERLWAAHTTQAEPTIVPTIKHDAGARLLELSGNLRRFWADRGYRVKLKQTKTRDGVQCWLVPNVRTRDAETVGAAGTITERDTRTGA